MTGKLLALTALLLLGAGPLAAQQPPASPPTAPATAAPAAPPSDEAAEEDEEDDEAEPQIVRQPELAGRRAAHRHRAGMHHGYGRGFGTSVRIDDGEHTVRLDCSPRESASECGEAAIQILDQLRAISDGEE